MFQYSDDIFLGPFFFSRIIPRILTMLNTLTIQLYSTLWPIINHSQNFLKIFLINNINRKIPYSSIDQSYYDLGVIIISELLWSRKLIHRSSILNTMITNWSQKLIHRPFVSFQSTKLLYFRIRCCQENHSKSLNYA